MRKAIAALVALLLALAGAVSIAAPAQAAVSGTLTGWSGGYNVQVKINGSTKGELATLMTLKTDGGQSLSVYCIQINVGTSKGVQYTEGDFESSVQNPAKVLWVLEHGYPSVGVSALGAAAGVPNLSKDDAIAGTQVAVWHFSDAAAWADGGHPDAKKVYDYLTGPANVGSNPTVPASLSISPGNLTGHAGERLGPFAVTMSGTANATLSATNGAKITDGSGAVLTKAGNGDAVYLTLATAGSSTLTATATSAIETGRVFLSAGKQSLILADSATADTTATATATWKKVTTVDTLAAPTFVDGTCEVDNSLTTPQVDGIDWKVDGSVGWGRTVTVTATAKAGYVIAGGVQTSWKHTYPVAPDCRTSVAPVAPTVSFEMCVAPGQPGGIVITPAVTEGIVYSVEGRTVTATAQAGHRLVAAEGWTLHEDGTASFEVSTQNPDGCVVGVAPVAPQVSFELCVAPGQPGGIVITPAVTEGIVYSVEGRTVTATAQAGHRLVAAEGWTLHEDGTASFEVSTQNPDDCVVTAEAVAPTVVQSEKCEVEGTVTFPETVGIEYLLDGEPVAGTITGPVSGTVTAQAREGYALSNPEWSYALDVPAAATCTPPTDGGSTPPTDGGSTPPTDGGSTPPGGNGGNLPHTGSDAATLLLGGLLALAGGAALVLVSRTRRPGGRHL